MYWLGNFIQLVDFTSKVQGCYYANRGDYAIAFSNGYSTILKFHKTYFKQFGKINGRFILTDVHWFHIDLYFEITGTDHDGNYIRYIIKKPTSWNNIVYRCAVDIPKTTVSTHCAI